MTLSLVNPQASKSMHKPRGVMSDKERLANFDEDEAASVLLVLADDPDFQRKGRQIAEKPSEAGRRKEADSEAKRYVPYKGPAQDLMAQLLLLAAQEPWRPRGAIMRDFFANLPRSAVWAEAPLDELDGRRVRERWATLQEGAHALARFGAGRCIECGQQVGGDGFGYSGRGVHARRSRRTHCEPCHCVLSRIQGAIESQLDRKRQALDALTSRRRRQRATRRAG